LSLIAKSPSWAELGFAGPPNPILNTQSGFTPCDVAALLKGNGGERILTNLVA